MKNFFILTYNAESIEAEQLMKIFEQVQSVLKPTQKLIVLPDSVTLTDYTKEELVNFLEKYQRTIEGLINE